MKSFIHARIPHPVIDLLVHFRAKLTDSVDEVHFDKRHTSCHALLVSYQIDIRILEILL